MMEVPVSEPAPGGRRFRYLFPSTTELRPDAEVLSLHADTDAVRGGKFAVRDEAARCFRLFASSDAYWRWSATLAPDQRCCHEVIFGALPQRLKFDVDAPADVVEMLDTHLLDRLSPGWDAALRYPPELLEHELETILGEGAPQAPFVAPVPAASQLRQYKAEAVLAYLVALVVDVFEVRYPGRTLSPADVYVASSLGDAAAPAKFSYHILLAPYAVATHAEARAFTAEVLAEMEAEAPELRRLGLLDAAVNSSCQNFRLPGSQKPGTGRPKVFSPALAERLGTGLPASDADALVSVSALPAAAQDRIQALPALEAAAPGDARPVMLASEDLASVLALVERASPAAWAAHTFKRAMPRADGAVLTFRRERPSHCALCARYHDSDHSLMILVRPADGGPEPAADRQTVEVVELCRRAAGCGQLLGAVECAAGTFVSACTARAEAALSRSALSLRAQVAALQAGRRDPAASADQLFARLPAAQQTSYAAPAMRPFEPAPTLAVQAQMGLGKTRELRAYLDAHYPRPAPSALAPPPVIRFVTFRQTFSEALRREFGDFVIYSDVPAAQISAAAAPRLVVQVESLHRLIRDAMFGPPPDLLVLDEVESVLAQFSSGLHKSFNESFAVFQWLLRNAGRVVCMDANLSDRTYRTLERLRPQHPLHFHHNRHARAAGDTVHVTLHPGSWLDRFVAAVRDGKKVAFASNSLREAKSVLHLLGEMFPEKAMKLYSSETALSEKKLHFADVRTHWAAFDVLAYTPTVSAGVSYYVEDPDAHPDAVFDTMFVYLTDASCDVETARQMLGRVRQLRDREYFVCLRSIGNAALPTDVATLERLAYDRRRLVVAGGWSKADRPPTAQFDPVSGELRRYQSPFFHLWLETTRIENLSKQAYAQRFVDQVAATGAAVAYLEADADRQEITKELVARKASAKEWLTATEAHDVAGAPELSSEEVTDIRLRSAGRSEADADVTAAERHGVTKFFLRRRYDWEGPVTPEFVRVYRDLTLQRIYSNLSAVLDYPAFDAALAAVRQQELVLLQATGSRGERAPAVRPAALVQTMQSDAVENVGIRYKYRYPSFCLCAWLLRICGFGSVRDLSLVPREWLEASLLLVRRHFLSQLPALLHEFSLRHPGHKAISSETAELYMRAALQVVNGALRSTFGVEVAPLGPRKQGIYTLQRTKFSKQLQWPGDPENAGRPRLPATLQPTHGPHTPAELVDGGSWDYLLFGYYRELRLRLQYGGGGSSAEEPAGGACPDEFEDLQELVERCAGGGVPQPPSAAAPALTPKRSAFGGGPPTTVQTLQLLKEFPRAWLESVPN